MYISHLKHDLHDGYSRNPDKRFPELALEQLYISESVILTGSFSIEKLRRSNKIEAYTTMKMKATSSSNGPQSGWDGVMVGVMYQYLNHTHRPRIAS